METTTHAPILGIDVSKKKLDAALLDGGKLKNKVVENNKAGYAELIRWVGKQKVDVTAVHACMESTGIYSEPVAINLQETGMKVSVVNPGCIKGFAQSENIRNKNDKIDAGIIARYCRAMTPELWIAPPPAQRLLRGWMERLSALQDIRQQEATGLKRMSLLARQSWPRTPRSTWTGSTLRSNSSRAISTVTSTAIRACEQTLI